MTTCLARIQAAIRLSIGADPAEATSTFQRQVSLFEQHLERQRADNRFDDPRPFIDELTHSFRALHASGATTLLEPDRSDRRRDYDQHFDPASLRIQLLLDELERSGRRDILNAHQTAGRALRQVTTLMAAAILVGLLLSLGSGYRLAHSIVAPIQALTRAARNLGQGDPTSPVQVTTRDELAGLASAFNEMAGQLERFRQSTSNNILRLHRTLQATLASFPDSVYVLGPNGTVELENLAATALPQNLNAAGTLPGALDALVANARASGASHLPSDFSEVICVRQESQDRFYLPRVWSCATPKAASSA
jgi:methyl-accepting chemotaxis protein